jgi:protein CMS1
VQRRIEAILKGGPKLKVAAPRVIVLALSGLRCADVVRGVRDVKGNGQVAKVSNTPALHLVTGGRSGAIPLT